jgi:hypothetical protein
MSEVGEQTKAKTKAWAEGVRDQLTELGEDFGGRYWKCGLLAVEAHEGHAWEILGLESEQDFREAVRIGRSTYFRCRRLAGEIALPLMKKDLITRKRLDRLTLENAEELIRLPEKQRFSPKWVEKALTMPNGKFEEHVSHWILNNTEPEEELGKKENQVFLKIQMFQSQKDVILSTFAEFASAEGIEKDDLAGALEGICADWHNTHQSEFEQQEEAIAQ